MHKLKVLIACEESQAVCKAFRELGMKRIVVIFRNVLVVTLNGIFKVTCYHYWKKNGI